MIRDFLPYNIFKKLFGDRKQFGKLPFKDDKDWAKWLSIYSDVYFDTQRSGGLASKINDAGYDVLKDVSLAKLNVAEIGPGGGYHFKYFDGPPANFNAIDVSVEFLEKLKGKVEGLGSAYKAIKVSANEPKIDLPNESQDVILTFYSLEHLHPIEDWIAELMRILKPGGLIVGGIPCEGGFAWGVGRFLTSRRLVKQKYALDLDKIVCWEHPNFADEIIQLLDSRMQRIERKFWPVSLMPMDFSLITKFIYKK